mmetsp:Transcript_13009/g.12619  ORF Transcript_13009/g.12619 Transcript_13009/m.12619 type:complete len:203 (-) Transcript_13009:359-967(-)
MMLLCCYLIALSYIVDASKQIVFRAAQKLSKPLNVAKLPAFNDWFSREETPDIILGLNPGITRVEKLKPNVYRGYLAPLKFPGLVGTAVVDFDVKFDGNVLEVNCRDDAVKISFDGPNKIFANAISSFTPIVVSTNILMVNKSSLCNNADIAIKFDLPSWFPIPKALVEKSGSDIIEKNLISDLSKLLDNTSNSFDLFTKKQ